MDEDFRFAEEALKPTLVPQEEQLWYNLRNVVWKGIRMHTTPEVRLVWALELVWLGIVTFLCCFELGRNCVFDGAVLPRCHYCGSVTFILWAFLLVVLWFLNLYTYILLASRGRRFSVRAPVALAKDITNQSPWAPLDPPPPLTNNPWQAGVLFIILSVLTFIWVVSGLYPIVSSNRCIQGINRRHTVQVNRNLWGMTFFSIAFFFPTFFFGRR